MKRIFVVLIFSLYSLYTAAQSHQQEIIDALVPKEKVKTNILYNRIIPFAGLQIFGQNGRQDTSSYAHFKQAYFELLQASYNSQAMLSLKQLEDWVRFKKEQNTVLLGLIDYAFNYSEDISLDKMQKSDFTPPPILKI